MIEFAAGQIKKAEELLGGIKGALPKVQTRAINRSLSTARAEAVRCVRAEYIVNAGDVRKTIKINNATAAHPTGSILSTGSPISLEKFDVSPKRPNTGKNKSVVTARVKKGGGKKPIKNAFIAKVSNGHTGVFVRSGKSRYPIRNLYGPSIPQMISAENVSSKIEEKAAEMMDKRLEHEISRVLEGNL